MHSAWAHYLPAFSIHQFTGDGSRTPFFSFLSFSPTIQPVWNSVVAAGMPRRHHFVLAHACNASHFSRFVISWFTWNVPKWINAVIKATRHHQSTRRQWKTFYFGLHWYLFLFTLCLKFCAVFGHIMASCSINCVFLIRLFPRNFYPKIFAFCFRSRWDGRPVNTEQQHVSGDMALEWYDCNAIICPFIYSYSILQRRICRMLLLETQICWNLSFVLFSMWMRWWRRLCQWIRRTRMDGECIPFRSPSVSNHTRVIFLFCHVEFVFRSKKNGRCEALLCIS